MLVTKLIQISQYCTIIIHKICNRCQVIQLGLKRMGTTQDRKKWRNRNTDILVKIVMVKHKPETHKLRLRFYYITQKICYSAATTSHFKLSLSVIACHL